MAPEETVMRRFVPLVLLALLAMFSAPSAAPGANYRLSEEHPASSVWTLARPGLADGRWIFYVHDAEVDQAHELWRVATAGKDSRADLGAAAGQCCGRGSCGDSRRRADPVPLAQDELGQVELFSAEVGGAPGSFVQVNAPLPTGLSVQGPLAFSPDSLRLVYQTNASPPSDTVASELWIADVDGGERNLLVSLPLEGHFGFDPGGRATHDFSRLIYRADAAVDGRLDLWSVPVAGGAPTKLNGALVAGGDVQGFVPSPIDDAVAYLADQQVEGRIELYIVPAAGGNVVKLSHALSGNWDILEPRFLPDGTRILYSEFDVDTRQIWSVRPDATDRVALVGPMVSDGAVKRYAFDSNRLVFLADKEVWNRFELYSVPIAGGTPVKLHPPLVAGGDVAIDWEVAPRITSDGTRVVYVADLATAGYENLYVVPIGGGPSVPVGGAGSLGGSRILDFEISPDGEWVAMVQELESFVPGGGISTASAWRASTVPAGRPSTPAPGSAKSRSIRSSRRRRPTGFSISPIRRSTTKGSSTPATPACSATASTPAARCAGARPSLEPSPETGPVRGAAAGSSPRGLPPGRPASDGALGQLSGQGGDGGQGDSPGDVDRDDPRRPVPEDGPVRQFVGRVGHEAEPGAAPGGGRRGPGAEDRPGRDHRNVEEVEEEGRRPPGLGPHQMAERGRVETPGDDPQPRQVEDEHRRRRRQDRRRRGRNGQFDGSDLHASHPNPESGRRRDAAVAGDLTGRGFG